jgi:hypothetical protein
LSDLEFDTAATDFVDYVFLREEHNILSFKCLQKGQKWVEKIVQEDLPKLPTNRASDDETDGDEEGNI